VIDAVVSQAQPEAAEVMAKAATLALALAGRRGRSIAV
jgi:hypothetical protein